MVSLAHQCLLTLLKSQLCDHENPIIADQVFDAGRNKMNNDYEINKLKNKIKKAKKKVHSMSGLKSINLDVYKIDKIVKQLTIELFEDFSWNKVRTKNHVDWKEYFHNLYDLIVADYDSDHASNLIVARELVNYHNVINEPVIMYYNDKLYPVISSINNLFARLKTEQRKTADKLSTMKEKLRSVHEQSTLIQYDIIEWQSLVRKLERENDVYNEICRWSIQ
jgi:septal ring factor EnvC (AmiA/AmiB activator)